MPRSKLAPCPWCGAKAPDVYLFWDWSPFDVDDDKPAWAACENCGARGPTSTDGDQDAIAKWNKAPRIAQDRRSPRN